LDSEESEEADGENPAPEESSEEDGNGEEKLEEFAPVASSSKGRKAPAWTDPDDTNLAVSLANNTRLRKLRDAPSDNVVGGREYERRLRRQFERINPTPDWASKARSKLSKTKRRRSSVSSEGEEMMEDKGDLEEILADTGGVLGKRKKALAAGTLSIERLRDANLAAPSEGAIKAIQFHPSTQIPVLLTASEDRRLRFFNVSVHCPFNCARSSCRHRLTDTLTHTSKPCTYPTSQ
jgi:U3 small nucleolar RNA-associated protein 18